ncbi:MAG TPA: hypothetical protein VK658_22895 [Chryseolinea sp.]|nr:hypothetical protein [Chryseolinea sp.]
MKQGIAWGRNSCITVVRNAFLLVVVALGACDDNHEPGPTPEPEVFNFRYLSVEVTSPVDANNVTKITFHADDLESYTYALNQNGSRRVNCSSNTFLDADDEMLVQDANSLSFKTDADVIFDIVDLNGNITRFTPTITGATSMVIHDAGAPLTDDERSAYIAEVTKQVNRMPNEVFEIR